MMLNPEPMPNKKLVKSKALIASDYFVYKNNLDNKGLTNKKLQKLLYYTQAWSVVLEDKKFFSEHIEAWVHGPSVPKVYRAYKKYGFGEINKEVGDSILNKLSKQEKKLLDLIWDMYGKYDGNYLETLSHSEDPWQKARKGFTASESSKKVISIKSMKDFYGRKLKRAKETEKGRKEKVKA